MGRLSYSLEFRGHATRLEPGVLITRASAPSELLRAGGEAVLEARVSLADDAFDVAGTVSFGMGDVLRFRSVGRGTIGPSPELGLSLGTAVYEIDGGAGRLKDASGRIASSFVLSDTGELTDHQLGLVYVEPARVEVGDVAGS